MGRRMPQEQMQATKARGQHNEITPSTNNPETLRVNITTNLTATGNLDEWLPKLMDDLSTLHPHLEPEGLDWHAWRPLYSYEGK